MFWFFFNYTKRTFSAWINETIAKITSPMLSQEVSGAEMLILRHQEYNAEINSRSEVLGEFYQTGRSLIQHVSIETWHIIIFVFRVNYFSYNYNNPWYFRVILCQTKSTRRSTFSNKDIISWPTLGKNVKSCTNKIWTLRYLLYYDNLQYFISVWRANYNRYYVGRITLNTTRVPSGCVMFLAV